MRKLQANNPYKYKYKNSQQNTSKTSSAAYKRDHISQPRGIHPQDARVVQQMQINVIYNTNRMMENNTSTQLMQKKHLTKSNTLS